MSSAKAFHERRIPSGVRGLDHLLKGGIPSLDPHPQGISILLRGAPGTGKTVLAAQLCCNGFLAKSLPEEAQKAGWTSFKRFRVVYYDLEQSLERFQNLLDAFGFEPMAVAKPEEGPLTHPRVTSYAPDELKKYVNEHLKSSNQDERYLLVIDGIDAFQEPFFDRSTLDVIRSNLLDQGHWILFLAEAVSEHYSKYPFVDYMADVVMELRVRKVEEYSRRLIEIVKCRGSEYIRGEHVFMILPKAKDEGTAKRLGEPGVRVFPSLDAKLSHWKEAEAFCTRYTFDFGISGLNEMLGSSDRTGPQTTLYIGPAGSGKAATALHFAVADCTGKCPRKTVLISFGCEEHSLASLAWQYEALRDLVDEQRMKFREDRIKFVYIAPSFLHAPKLLCRLENEIAGTDARKAIVIDLSHVRHRFPALNDEPMLFSALVQFFKYYKMCPIFVESLVLPSEEVESTGHFATPMASLADNVVEFRRLFFYGKDHICIRFHVTHGMPAEPGYRELVVSGPQDKPRRISVERTLDGFTDFFTGKPRRVPLGVYFFYENDLQFEFNQRLSRMLECAFPGLSVHRDLKIMGFTPQTAPSVARGLEFTTGSPQPDIRIAQLDEFWVETFRPEMLIPDPFSKDASFDRSQLIYPEDVHAKERTKYIPAYLNAGLMAVARQHLQAPIDKTWDGWKELHEDLRMAWERMKSDGRTEAEGFVPFDFDALAPESWSCLLLEILGSAGCLKRVGGTPATICIDLKARQAADALTSFHSVYWLGRDFRRHKGELLGAYYGGIVLPQRSRSGGRGGYRIDDGRVNPVNLNRKALIYRCWYSNYSWMTSQRPCGENPLVYRILPVPGGCSVRGDWSWGVIEKSTSEETGWRIVRTVLGSLDVTMTRYAMNIGMPAHMLFYEEHNSFPSADPQMNLRDVLARIWKPSIRRSHIPGYRLASPILSRFLLEVLCVDPSQDHSIIREAISNIARAFHTRLTAVVPNAVSSST